MQNKKRDLTNLISELQTALTPAVRIERLKLLLTATTAAKLLRLRLCQMCFRLGFC